MLLPPTMSIPKRLWERLLGSPASGRKAAGKCNPRHGRGDRKRERSCSGLSTSTQQTALCLPKSCLSMFLHVVSPPLCITESDLGELIASSSKDNNTPCGYSLVSWDTTLNTYCFFFPLLFAFLVLGVPSLLFLPCFLRSPAMGASPKQTYQRISCEASFAWRNFASRKFLCFSSSSKRRAAIIFRLTRVS